MTTRLKVLLGVGAMLIAIMAWAAYGGAERIAENRPGNQRVLAEIEVETDCHVLQAGFDSNMADFDRREPGDPLRGTVLAHAEAQAARLGEVCP